MISVYARESPAALREALQSMQAQTHRPGEILLIKDGPLTDSLERVIEQYVVILGMRVLALPSNLGLAKALNMGLAAATQPWVMRFDSDDVSVPDRVERQVSDMLSENLDLFGAQIAEFVTDASVTSRRRIVPCMQEEIRRFALRRNPFNHMTVCFRRSFALQVGGYPDIPFMEDYALWLKMLAAGARTKNAPDVLVRARVGNGMIDRRGGLRYVRSEWRLQSLMLQLRMKPLWRCAADGCMRSLVFLSPASARTKFYPRYLRS